MSWWMILGLACLIIGPFDALYLYIKAERRKDEMRRRREADEPKKNEESKDPGDDA